MTIKTLLGRLSGGVIFEYCSGELNAPPFSCSKWLFLGLGCHLGCQFRVSFALLCMYVFRVSKITLLGCHLGCHLSFFLWWFEIGKGIVETFFFDFPCFSMGKLPPFCTLSPYYIKCSNPLFIRVLVCFSSVLVSQNACVLACVGICGVSEWLPLAVFDDFERHHPT